MRENAFAHLRFTTKLGTSFYEEQSHLACNTSMCQIPRENEHNLHTANNILLPSSLKYIV